MKKIFSIFALLLGMSLTAKAADNTVTIDLSTGYVNEQMVGTITSGDITIATSGGTNSYSPTYYNQGHAVRFYGGNTFTVSADGNTISKIELTFSSGEGTNQITANPDSFNTNTWTGSANSVTFTIGGRNGHRRIASIAVTYAKSAPTTVAVESVTIDKETATLTVDGTETLTATVSPENATDKTVTWSSSNTSVATVENGVVTAVAAGTATITCTSNADGTKSATCDVTVNADDPYASIKNTTKVITFDSKEWYLIDYDASTVTLLSKECVGASAFSSYSNTYNGSTVENFVNNWYTNNITANAKAAVKDGGMFLLSTDEANTINSANADVLKCSQASDATSNYWWLRSSGSNGSNAACVNGNYGSVGSGGFFVTNVYGVRPALKLDLSKVTFDPDSKTFSVSAAAQSAYAAYDVTTDANKTKSGDDLTALAVKFNDIDWYIIEDNSTAADAGTVTLFAADPIGASEFHSSSNVYSSSTVKTYLDDLTASGGGFADVADAIVSTDLTDVSVTAAKLYLLSTTGANNLPENVRKCSQASDASGNLWWLRSPGDNAVLAAHVDGDNGNVNDFGVYVGIAFGVRPALQLDLSKVEFDSDSKTFSVTVAEPTYTVTVKDGTEDAANWSIDPATAEEGQTVTITYNGTKKVKSVKAVKKATEVPEDGAIINYTDANNLTRECIVVTLGTQKYAIATASETANATWSVDGVAYYTFADAVKYFTDGSASGQTGYSAANVWRLPTQSELTALKDLSSKTWDDTNKGYNWTIGSASLFLPAAGYCYDGDDKSVGVYGDYWSSTPNGDSYAYFLDFSISYCDVYDGSREGGFAVRLFCQLPSE